MFEIARFHCIINKMISDFQKVDHFKLYLLPNYQDLLTILLQDIRYSYELESTFDPKILLSNPFNLSCESGLLRFHLKRTYKAVHHKQSFGNPDFRKTRLFEKLFSTLALFYRSPDSWCFLLFFTIFRQL